MKQFNKIKHFADKALSRPDRTEVLSEDLLDAERKIELIKQTCESTAKKVSACLQLPSKDGQPLDKRINKVPEVVLGYNMMKHGKELGSPESRSVLGGVLTEAGEIEIKVGNEIVNYEVLVEGSILGPLHKLVEQDLPKIEKIKRTLSKLTSDMDTARAKLSQASRHSMSATTGKIDNIKDDLEETQQKVEQCRDNLAAEMYQLIARETEISKYIVSFLQYQRDYHHTVFSVVNDLLPNVESILANSYNKPVFGVDLDEHLHATNRTIAYALELCVCGLMETGLEEEGLFRIAGSASKVKKLKAAFDAGYMHLNGLINEFSDPHVIGNALKCYLRELPAPLLTFELYEEWMAAIQTSNSKQKLLSLKTVVDKLPKTNFDNLRYLIKFLFELSKHQGINKMTPANIAIVIGPNLLWMPSNLDDPVGENNPMGMNMTMTHLYTSLVDQLVTNADYFFPEEVEYFVTCSRPTDSDLNTGGANGGFEYPVSNHANVDSVDGLAYAKRSQSSSSLEDQNSSPPQGSPKPVLRRKNKPAPVPPNLVKSTNSVSPPSKAAVEMVPSKASLMVNEGNTSEAASKRLSSAKRETMWIPPSPNQMTNRRHLGSSSSATGGNALSIDPPPSAVGVMKVVPPKPPQPQFAQLQLSHDAEFKSTLGDGNKPPSQIQCSTLRHKSSFNSGNTVENSLVSSPGHNINPNQSNPSLQYSHSLPRHFHTENSYKNQRAPRPPSNFYAIPSVPNTTSVASSATTATTTQNQIDINSKSNNVLPPAVTIPHQAGTLNNRSNESTDGPSVPKLPDSVPGQIVCTGSSQAGPEIISGVDIGFEKIETEVRRLSETSTGSCVSNVQEKLRDNTSSEDCAGSTATSTSAPSIESGRPVPAPRSSLLLQNVSIGKEKEKEAPAAKGRPTLMAKPRDLAKRSHVIAVGGNSASVIASSTGTTVDPNIAPEVTTPAQIVALGLTIPIPVDVGDAGDSDGGFTANHKNGGSKDKTLPPQSPRAPYRPPRPQPPPPPKAKAESTDL